MNIASQAYQLQLPCDINSIPSNNINVFLWVQSRGSGTWRALWRVSNLRYLHSRKMQILKEQLEATQENVQILKEQLEAFLSSTLAQHTSEWTVSSLYGRVFRIATCREESKSNLDYLYALYCKEIKMIPNLPQKRQQQRGEFLLGGFSYLDRFYIQENDHKQSLKDMLSPQICVKKLENHALKLEGPATISTRKILRAMPCASLKMEDRWNPLLCSFWAAAPQEYLSDYSMEVLNCLCSHMHEKQCANIIMTYVSSDTFTLLLPEKAYHEDSNTTGCLVSTKALLTHSKAARSFNTRTKFVLIPTSFAALREIGRYLAVHYDKIPKRVSKPLRSKLLKHCMECQWDAEWMTSITSCHMQLLYDIIQASNFMDMQTLLHLGCASCATKIKGPLEQIKDVLRSDNKNSGSRSNLASRVDMKCGQIIVGIGSPLAVRPVY